MGKIKMPALAKPKHEIFAQEIANGTHVTKAYEKAGYKFNHGNASTLKNTKEIQERVSEILDERRKPIVQQFAAEVEYTRERVLNELEEARQMALENAQSGAAWQAAFAKARVLGLVVDRREVGEVGAFNDKTDEELVAEAAKRARELGIAGPSEVEEDKSDLDDGAKTVP